MLAKASHQSLPMELQPRGLSTGQAARYLGISVSYLNKSRCDPERYPGPSFLRIGRRILYLVSDLDSFIDHRRKRQEDHQSAYVPEAGRS